jgi:farnesyl diphosphate synthase
MDDDDLRRGQPTAHRAFDEATAILAGDALQVFAFSLLARDFAPDVGAEARINMIRILADASGTEGMAGGQAIDLSAVGRTLNLEELEAMHRLKTGALIRASVLIAAACSPSISEETRTALDGYAQDIGLAFQIQDDILDVEGNFEILGKATGADAARAKPTYPSIMGLEAAKTRAHDLHVRACERLAPLGPRAEVLSWLAAYVIEREM